MNNPLDWRALWGTVWRGSDILVLRDDVEVDRLPGGEIRRVVFVQHGRGIAGTSFAVVELAADHVVLPARCGFAGRVHFERQAFWAAKACVYWADAASARLPPSCLERRGFILTRREPSYLRLPHAELAGRIAGWELEGPQSWDERRWRMGLQERPEPLPTLAALAAERQQGPA